MENYSYRKLCLNYHQIPSLSVPQHSSIDNCIFKHDYALLYPRHLCRGVYSFRLSVRPFVCTYACSFVLPSRSWNYFKVLRASNSSGFSHQPLIRKHSYLDNRFPRGSAFIPRLLTPGSMFRGGARGKKLGHL